MTFNPPSPRPAPATDWTTGPAKFILVAILGLICGTGLAWSILRAPAPTATMRTSTSGEPPDTGGAMVDQARGGLKVADVPEPKRYEEVVDESVAGSVTARAAGPGGAGPVVPQKSAANDGAKGTKGAAGGLLNVNTATQAELELLPGIGPALASRIVEYRTAKGPFRSMSDLDAVSGIGPKMLEKLKPLVRFE